MKNILIVIDDVEFKYFELNKLVTNFWLIYEFLRRGFNVFITLKSKLFQKRAIPYALCWKTFIKDENIFKEDKNIEFCLNDFKLILFRPDPPVDVDYINASYILSYVDKNTLVMNSPDAIREKNEKLYINEFMGLVPDNIVSADEKIIKEFLFEKKEIVIKPTNLCFGSGVFYLNSNDKNINSIILTATNKGKTQVMVQEYLPQIKHGDKRLIYICGKTFEYCVKKVASNDDFKFNEHNQNTLKPAFFDDKDAKISDAISEKLVNDGVFFAGLDVIDGKIIEINITSPCFFIKEINEIYNIEFEKMIVDEILKFANIENKCILEVL